MEVPASELTITAGQLSGRVICLFEPPLTGEQLDTLRSSEAMARVEQDESETSFTNRIVRFRPTWGDFSEHLTLNSKKIVLTIGELLTTPELTVTTQEAVLDGRDWYFDYPVPTRPILKEEVEPVYEHRRSNEQAVLTMVGMMGGWGAAIANHRLEDLAAILESDADDDLSGLRTIARLNEERASGEYQEQPVDDGVVSPEAARHWLLTEKRAEELPTGELRLLPKNTDHMTLAGLWIAQQDEHIPFDEAYRRMHPDGELTDDLVRQAGVMINHRYFQAQQAATRQ